MPDSEDENREAMLAAMYQDTDDGDGQQTRPDNTARLSGGASLTRRVRVGAIEYELPTVEYVQRLEQVVRRQSELIDQQRRTLDRVLIDLSRLRNTQNAHRSSLDSARRELATKLSVHTGGDL